jgi:hypothetical protein
LDNVTVYGGIRIDPSPDSAGDNYNFARVGFDSTIYGGVRVGAGSWLGVGIVYATGEVNKSSTVNGGIVADHPLGIDVEFATVRGGVSVNGFKDPSFLCGTPDEGCFGTPTLCGDEIFGNVDVSTGASPNNYYIGDPEEQFFANAACDSNTIRGAVYLRNSNFLNPFEGEGSEIEGDTVAGSVHVDHSTAEVYSNTIGGSLLCTNGSVMQAPLPGDPSSDPNTVSGVNTCF